MEEFFISYFNSVDKNDTYMIDKFNEMISDSEIVSFLINAIRKTFQEKKTNHLSLYIYTMLHVCKSTSFSSFSSEVKISLLKNLIELIFLLSNDFMLNLSECLRYLFTNKSIDYSIKGELVSYSISNILQMDEKLMLPSLIIFKNWLRCDDVYRDASVSTTLFNIVNVFVVLLNTSWKLHVHFIVECLLYICTKNIVFENENMIKVWSFLLDITVDSECKDQTRELFLNNFSLHFFIFSKIEKNSAYCNKFIEIILPKLPNFFNLIVNRYNNQVYNGYIMIILKKLVSKGYFLDLLFEPEFFIGTIMKALELIDSDIEAFETIPSNFISCCYFVENEQMDLLESGYQPPRIMFNSMMHILAKKVSDIKKFSFFIQVSQREVTSFLEQESNMFLLASIGGCIPIFFGDTDQMISELYNLFTVSKNHIFSSTCLVALLSLSKSSNFFSEMALHILCTSQIPCIQLISCHLFLKSYDSLAFEAEVDIEKLLSVLLDLVTTNPDEKPLTVIRIISARYSDALVSVFPLLISNILKTWNPSLNTSCLSCITQFISLCTINKEALLVLNNVIDFLSYSINSDNSPFESDFFDILFCIAKKLDELFIPMFNLIHNMITNPNKYFRDIDSFYYLINFFSCIKTKAYFKDQIILNMYKNLMNISLSLDFHSNNILIINAINSVSLIYQHINEVIVELIEPILSYTQITNNEQLIVSINYLIAVVIKIDDSIFLKLIDNNIINYMINSCEVMWKAESFILPTIVESFLQLVKNGIVSLIDPLYKLIDRFFNEQKLFLEEESLIYDICLFIDKDDVKFNVKLCQVLLLFNTPELNMYNNQLISSINNYFSQKTEQQF